MVLLVYPNEEIGNLHEVGHVRFAYLGNRFWYPSFVDVIASIKRDEQRRVPIDMDFAAKAVETMYYICSANFSLEIGAQRVLPPDYLTVVVLEYYEYDSWCWSVFLPDNTCTADNTHGFHVHNNLSLEPPPSLYTIVPTQLSGFI